MNTTDTIELFLIAALRNEDLAIVDAHAVGTTDAGASAYWWFSLANDFYDPPTLDGLDKALVERGLVRVRDWEPRITAAGLIRYFATATTTMENLSVH